MSPSLRGVPAARKRLYIWLATVNPPEPVESETLVAVVLHNFTTRVRVEVSPAPTTTILYLSLLSVLAHRARDAKERELLAARLWMESKADIL